MKPDKARRKRSDARATKRPKPSDVTGDTENAEDTDLGYAEDAGHPGGTQDLDAKTESEGEHDTWGRHG